MRINKQFIVGLIFTITFTNFIFGQSLSNNLKILEPLTKKIWKGDLVSPDGSQVWETTHEFISLWDGTIIKYKSSTPELNSYSEGFFYWDRSENKIATFVVNNNGVYQDGFVTVIDGIITIKGKISFPNTTFDYKNTLELTDDGKLVDRWFQNAFGDWQTGHVIDFSMK